MTKILSDNSVNPSPPSMPDPYVGVAMGPRRTNPPFIGPLLPKFEINQSAFSRQKNLYCPVDVTYMLTGKALESATIFTGDCIEYSQKKDLHVKCQILTNEKYETFLAFKLGRTHLATRSPNVAR